METGEPVKPWLSSTPIRRPPVSSGRASTVSGSYSGFLLMARLCTSVGGSRGGTRLGAVGSRGKVCRGVLLVPQVRRARAVAQAGLPAVRRRGRPGAGRGAGDPRQQPPVLRRLAV